METYYNSTDEKRKRFDDVYMLGSPKESINEAQKSMLRLSAWTTFWVGHAAGYVDGCVDMYEIGYKDGREEDREGSCTLTDAEAGTHTL